MHHTLDEHRIFYKKVSLINMFTCCSIFLYSLNLISVNTVINGEVLITLYKWYEELKYGYTLKSYDITFHHLGLFLIVIIVNMNMPQRKEALVKALSIHIPFLFKSIKRSTDVEVIKKNSETIFLVLWFPVSGYRLTVLFNCTLDAYYNSETVNSMVLFIYFIVFLMLDLSWTPWKKYKQILSR